MSLVSRWTHSIARAGRESMALSRAVVGALRSESAKQRKNPTTLAAASSPSVGETVKSVLLQEARRESLPNHMAISLLKVDKEIGLVRYWGLAEYLRQNQPLSSLAKWSSQWFSGKTSNSLGTDKAKDATTTTNTNSNAASASHTPGNAAKIAFMITSSMKQELTQTLGYSASAIKGMTPQQASLVLHHRLAPDAYEQEISQLEQAFEEERDQRNQQQLEETSEESQLQRAPSTDGTTKGSERTAMVGDSGNTEESSSDAPLLLSSSSSSSSSSSVSPESSSSPSSSPPPTQQLSALSTPLSTEDDSIASAASFLDVPDSEDIWYEVVEVKSTDENENEIRHGLYKDKEEALLGLETRQNIQRKREQEAPPDINAESDAAATGTTKFVLRPISVTDLQ